MVRRLTSPRLEFEAAAIYEYPEHLRSFLNDLPTRPGVYLFHGESDTMPLYIGKSVNIRSRVLSHLRLSLIHISEPTRREWLSRMPSSA